MPLEPPKLLPYPRRIDPPPSARRIAIGDQPVPHFPPTKEDLFALDLLGEAIDQARGRARKSVPGSKAPVLLYDEPLPGLGPFESEQGYQIRIRSGGVEAAGPTPAARYYAIQTLRQLVRQYGAGLPTFKIVDAPRYDVRGYLLDVSRGRVPRREALDELVAGLGALKYNELQLYVEHAFAFAIHPELGEGHSPLTPDDIRDLDDCCRRHHIDLVPCLQSFGHAHHILKHPEHAALAESDFRGGWTLSPVEEGTYSLLGELYRDFLPHFERSRRFNACCDETWDLGLGKSKKQAKRVGLGRVYLEHLLRVRALALVHKPEVMFWGDILEKHSELLGELPEDVGLLHWNYDADGGAAKHYRSRLAPYKAARRRFGVCPGTSAWNSLFFRMDNARVNIERLAREGMRAGASELLLTDWGDNGHYNFQSWSLWPLAWAAECAWRGGENADAKKGRSARRDGADEGREIETPAFDERFALQVLGDATGAWIEPLRRLGSLYKTFGVHLPNHSPERWLLTGAPRAEVDVLGVAKMIQPFDAITPRRIATALAAAETAALALERLSPEEPDHVRVRDEWLLAARLAVHACRRGLWVRGRGEDPRRLREEARELAEEFERLWLAQNRESDLQRVREDFAAMEEEYKAGRPVGKPDKAASSAKRNGRANRKKSEAGPKAEARRPRKTSKR